MWPPHSPHAAQMSIPKVPRMLTHEFQARNQGHVYSELTGIKDAVTALSTGVG